MSRLRRQASLVGALVLLTGSSPQHGIIGVRAGTDTSEGFSIGNGGPIQTLTRPTFISSVLGSSSPALVWLYAGSDCPNCETLLPHVEEAAGKLFSWGVSVAAVDVSKETRLRRDLSIPKGLPMMFKVYHSESTPNPYGGLPVRSEEIITIFQDARTLQKKVLTAIPDSVVSVDLEKGSSAPSSNLKAALMEGDSGEGFAAILFTEAGKASPVLRVLANEVKGRVGTVQARLPRGGDDGDDEDDGVTTGERLAGLLKGVVDIPGTIPSVPCLVVMNKESKEGSVYEGAVDDAKTMLAFIRDRAGISATTPGATSGASDEDDKEQKEGGGGQTSKSGGLLRLDPELLSTLEEKGTEALVVAFVEGGDVDSIPGWGEATKGLEGQIRAGVLDCSDHPAQCQGSPKQKAPYIKVYPHGKGIDGDRRAFPSEFTASEVKEAIAEAEASLPELATVVPAGIGNQKIQDAVHSFLSASIFSAGGPMCLIVLSRKDEPNLVVKTVSAAFQAAKVRTLFISKPEEEFLASVGVFKLPAMMLMFPRPEGMEVSMDPNQREPGDGERAMVTAHYSPAHWGAVTHDHVSEFIMSHLSSVDTNALLLHAREMSQTAKLNRESLPINLKRFLNEFDKAEEAGWSSSPGDSGSAASFQGVPEVSREIWASITGQGTGGGNPRTVGIFFLDRFSESFASALQAAENAAENALARLGKAASGGIGFVWADAPCQEGFAKMLGVSDASEVPVLVVFSPKHNKSARFVGAWKADSLGTFLGKALGGRTPLFPVDDEAPRLDESVDCSQRPAPAWLAGDGEGMADTAEDDDMGDFMAEILAEEAKAKRELEEEVAKDLLEMNDAKGEAEAAPKPKKKTVKRKKKKSSGSRSEL